MNIDKLSASFRDPSGFVFNKEGKIYRQVNRSYASEFDLLMSTGLYAKLTKQGQLIEHREIDPADVSAMPNAQLYKIIQPSLVPYISYPYEWSFSQLKDAALLTLSIQITALNCGMSLKDASAYNIQFIGSRPVFIDTLSFEQYTEGDPWVAYRQFCQHFLGPLALMANTDMRLQHLLRSYIDGLPLDLVSRLLPRHTYFRYGLLSHLHLHAASQTRHQDDSREQKSAKSAASLSKKMQLALIESLTNVVTKCELPEVTTEWGDYYEETNYSDESMTSKEQLVAELVDAHAIAGELIHDLGGNTGRFSRLVAAPDRYVISHDVDEMAVEQNYRINRKRQSTNVLALQLNLTNPSPGQGWAHEERDSLVQRVDSGLIMALALVHHLAIGNNVPLSEVARFFHRIANKMIVEFIPKEDSQIQRLLASRKDIFLDYNKVNFEKAFERYFDISAQREIDGTLRTLYVMERK